jgi:hypothetical protein
LLATKMKLVSSVRRSQVTLSSGPRRCLVRIRIWILLIHIYRQEKRMEVVGMTQKLVMRYIYMAAPKSALLTIGMDVRRTPCKFEHSSTQCSLDRVTFNEQYLPLTRQSHTNAKHHLSKQEIQRMVNEVEKYQRYVVYLRESLDNFGYLSKTKLPPPVSSNQVKEQPRVLHLQPLQLDR